MRILTVVAEGETRAAQTDIESGIGKGEIYGVQDHGTEGTESVAIGEIGTGTEDETVKGRETAVTGDGTDRKGTVLKGTGDREETGRTGGWCECRGTGERTAAEKTGTGNLGRGTQKGTGRGKETEK